MTKEEFQAFYVLVRPWIAGVVSGHAAFATSTASFLFPRLSSYCCDKLLDETKVVVVERVPMAPLKRMGLKQFAAFEELNPLGVSYSDTYFVRSLCRDHESLHFHELVHCVQWRLLGPERFLATYFEGLEQQNHRAEDYRKSPLELMAYGLQARFEEVRGTFDIETEVAAQLMNPKVTV